MRKSDRRLERIADHVVQYAVTFEPTGSAQIGGTLRMNEDEYAKLLGLGPERVKFWIRQLLAVDASADQCAAQPELADRKVQLLGSEVGVLQSDRGEADKAVGLRRADLGELFVLQANDLCGEIGLGLVPKDRVDAQRLSVDPLLVHCSDPLRGDDERGRLHL